MPLIAAPSARNAESADTTALPVAGAISSM